MVGLESNPTFLYTSDLAQDADPAGTAAGAGRVPDSGSIQNEPPKLDPDGTYPKVEISMQNHYSLELWFSLKINLSSLSRGSFSKTAWDWDILLPAKTG